MAEAPLTVRTPATFNDFIGNAPAVEHLRASIAHGRLPHSFILAGSSGAGKYTLALMLAMTVECERQPRDLWSNGQSLAGFCGTCRNCTRIAEAADLEAAVDQAVGAREDLRETDKKETRVLIQPHPDVLIIPPDPPQLLIKLGQMRTLIHSANYLPAEAPRKIFIITASSFMKEAANSLLKVLEEPPATVHIILLSENPGELLPTIRSRCALVRLGALPTEEIAMLLAEPSLANEAESPYAFAALEKPGVPLLIELLDVARARPGINTAALLEHFAQREESSALQKLAMIEFPGEPEALRTEFIDALRRLVDQTVQQRLDALIRKQAESTLDEIEKSELRELLARKGAAGSTV